MKNKFFIVAGEPSGDTHAARLMNAIKQILPNVEFIGIGGKEMEKQGLKSLVPISEISVVGFWEVAKKYKFFTQLLEKCKDILKNEKFNAFIAVDYPGFNIKLATYAKSLSIPVVYYIAPQLWAWGKNRAPKLAKAVDLLLVVFPFEVAFFKQYGINVQFVGHPLLDDEIFNQKILNYSERENIITLLPGSRKQEIARHLPMMEQTAILLHKQFPNFKIHIAKSPNVGFDLFDNISRNHKFITINEDTKKLLSIAKVGAVKTGTSNLEACLLGMPFVMYYKTSAITYFLGRKLINLPYISLVNILKNELIVPEIIQKDARPAIITSEIAKMIDNESLYAKMQCKFLEIKNQLGHKGASSTAAETIINFLKI